MEENPEDNGNRPVTIRSPEEVMDTFLKVYYNEEDINDKDIKFSKEIERAINDEHIGTSTRTKDEISPASDDIGVNKSYVKEEKGKQCETCNITVENENELKIHRKLVHGPIPDRDRPPGKSAIIKSSASKKSALEKQIYKVSNEINVCLEMHKITPAVGNCWYEACSSLMKLNRMRDMSSKELRKKW